MSQNDPEMEKARQLMAQVADSGTEAKNRTEEYAERIRQARAFFDTMGGDGFRDCPDQLTEAEGHVRGALEELKNAENAAKIPGIG